MPVTLEQVLAELRSLDVDQMCDALCIVGEYDDPRVADALLEVLPSLSLDREHANVIGQVVAHLGALGDRRAVQPILDVLRQDLDIGVDHQLEGIGCEALVKLRAVESLPFLRAALIEWPYHEDTVANAIAAIGGAGEASFFIDALGSGNPDVVIAAAKALATLGAAEAVPALERLRTAENPDVQAQALIAIVRLQPDHAPALLAELLAGAQDYRDKWTAISMIGASGIVSLAPLLSAKLDDAAWCDGPWLRFAIFDALIALRHPATATMLEAVRSARRESPWCRIAATARLVRGRAELARGLLEVLRSADYHPSVVDPWNWIIDAASEAIAALDAVTATSAGLRVPFIELMDDIRRERLKVPQGGIRDKASQVVKATVGSDRYADYDRWRADQSSGR